MSVKFLFVIFGGIALSLVENARILPRVKRQSLKVRITAKDDSIVLQYLSTSPVIKLQGYVLGLGGRFSKQNITLPGNGDPIEVDVDFNPKYLVAVHPVAEQNNAALGKKCKGIPDLHKPPQLSIDPQTPTSVLLTWGFNFKDKGYKVGKECESERQYTIRYREKERDKKWKYHLCPTSEATIDNLKPNTVYEFGIRVTKAKGDGVWSKPTIYSTTIAPQPRSTKNDQSEKKLLNKVEVNFNSENSKHPKKPELPGKTNIKGMTAVKQLGAPSSAHNRTSLKLLPKKPEISTKAIVGSQSTSDRVDVQPEKKPTIIRKPEHTRDELHDKEEIKEVTTNTVSKPSLKTIKTRKESEKPAMKPLTTKESKLSSSVSPSFPSKPLLHSDRTEIQLPVYFTPSTASELDTMDKFTESETPSPTIMPFITLRTTSDHADVRNQDLPEAELPSSSNSLLSTSDTTSALDSVETKQFSEPEMPPTSSKLSEPTSEPDDKDTQKFTEHKIRSFSTTSVNPIPESVSMDVERFTELPSSTSSFSSSSNMASKPDVTDTMWLTETEPEEPSSWNALYITSPTTSAPDSVDYKQFTEYVVEPTTSSVFTTSNTIYEFDSTQRKQTSDPEVSSFTTTKVFITSNPSNPTTEADDEVQQPYAEYEVPISDINNMSTLTADHELPVTDTPNVTYPIPETESVKIRETEATGHKEPTTDTPSMFRTISGSKPQDIDPPNVFNMIPESVTTKIRVTEVTDRKLPKSDNYTSNPAPISEHGYTEEQEFKAPEPTDSETSHMLISTPRSELDKKEDKEITDYKQPASGTPNVLSQSQEPTRDKIMDEDLAESDPQSDIPFISTSKPVHKTNAKPHRAGPKTPSTVGQLPSTSSRSTQKSPPVFRSTPVSNIDGQGQERFRGPHVKYLTKENMPCSVTESLRHFQEEDSTNATALTAPKYPPSNLTLVTVEGCPTFLIVDWKKNENDTASEYEVVSQMQGPDNKTEKLVTVTNQTHAAVENLKPNTSYTFSVTPTNKHGRGPSSDSLAFVTESADPSVSEYIPGKDAIWTQYSFKFDSYSECQGKRFVKRTRYRKFVGIVLCNSLRYKIYLSNSLSGIFYNIGDLSGHGEDHCQFVDSFLDGRTGEHLLPEQLPIRQGFYRSVRQEPVMFGTIGGQTHINYVHWYECGIAIPGQW
ncbi:target of Nesh-SH3 isoform X1 [Mobula hypostoma]|uniref:target of Nesh-SH3 isoform X1 n=1 Tax=Mobula hypostoma TaxID=723540 RepID=UPI002FC39B85